MPLTPGSRLGPYEIIAPLGAGGMGEVYRAHDARLSRDVAVKALPDGFSHDPERLVRFEREAKLLASLSHPNIAGIHGLEDGGGMRYLILEYVDGETLAARIQRGPLPLAEALDVARDIAAALEAAHESGVVHRDLKPGNVMVNGAGTVKVLDFGLAKGGASKGAGSDPSLSASPTMTFAATAAGVILGTAAYMSPEQARGKNVDRRTDIWSFGCVFYECLCGRQAFAGETVSDIVARILERDPDWAALPAQTPPAVRELIARCLRKDPKERLRDIGDARVTLDEIIKGGPVSAGTTGPVAVASRSPWLAVLVAVAVTAIVAAALTEILTRGPEPPPLHLSVLGPEGAQLSDEVPDLVIAPDGRTLAFTAKDSVGVAHLWLRPLDSDRPRVLAGTEGAVIPFWSPDSRNLAFFAGGSLKRVAATGEEMLTLCDAQTPRGGAWGPGNVIVFAPSASGPLMQISANGGTPTPATTLDVSRGETGHRFPSFLPDGRHFLYVTLPGKANQSPTRVGTVGGKPGPQVLVANSVGVYAAPGYLLFMRQGSVFAQKFDDRSMRTTGPARVLRDLTDATGSYSGSPGVSVSASGIIVQRAVDSEDEHVDVLDRSGKRLFTAPFPTGYLADVSQSPDGTQLAVAYSKRGAPSSPVIVADLRRSIWTRFSSEGSYESDPIWTRDGSRLIYGSDRPGGRRLYWKRVDGGPEELIATPPNLFNDPNTVTPDGRFLIYRSLSGETGEDLWIVDLDGNHQPKPLIRTPANELDADISPDGRWIAYRTDETGESQIQVQSFPALDRKFRVSIDGAVPSFNARMAFTRFRNDGRELYYIGRDGRTVQVVPITPGPELHVEASRPLFKLPPEAVDATASPDGQRFFVSMPSRSVNRGVIQIVMNWSRELESTK
jgi:Tol biopolymer transport system component